MEARLLDGLHHRLRQHELTIQATRRELLADFQRYYEDALRGVPLHHAASIRSAITASFLSSYPTLRPELPPPPPPIDSHPSGDPSSAAFQPSSSRPPASGSADTPGSPREREHELQGLFTPTYLPLLEGFPTLPRSVDPPALASPPGSPQPTSLPGMELQGTSRDSDPAAAADDKPDEQRIEYAALPDHPVTPTQLFNASTWPRADDSRSSVSSDKSDSKPTKSALRRSSSISKPPQSPRRVRFEFMGAEVLPTASPQPSDYITPRPPSPESDDGAGFSSNLGGQVGEEEDEEEQGPPPRKVSSSDALRALSRAPLDEGTVWTVVNADEDEAAPDAPPPAPDAPVGTWMSDPDQTVATDLSNAGPHDTTRSEVDHFRAESNEAPNGGNKSDDDDSSDDGFLAMAKTRKPKTSPAAAPALPTTSTDTTLRNHVDEQAVKSEVTATASDDDDDGDDDPEGDDMFFFEAGGLSAPPRPRPRPPLPDLEEDEDEAADDPTTTNDDESSTPTGDADDTKTSLFATSPAVPIRHGSRVSATVRFQPGSLGSYKGRPLMMPIVRNPEVLAEANSVKRSSLKVDGIDDETAMAEGSPPPFPSTPLSFRGRFIMEEMMKAREEKAEKGADKMEEGA
ncbi:UPF0023 family protein [Purpureocillium lavendulum]|uniref:UPF0023 family protein n=1 Tax=Purpureocillium lavendulum TaxID=1247861 RepID=A0AB34G4E3_9HYPO|nr:UPF0023 family protein [Purpureocillium lavendulum]